jgi:hypothetical protein
MASGHIATFLRLAISAPRALAAWHDADGMHGRDQSGGA